MASLGEYLASGDGYGCISCHSTDGTESPGRTWKGLYGTPTNLDHYPTVNDSYLNNSIALHFTSLPAIPSVAELDKYLGMVRDSYRNFRLYLEGGMDIEHITNDELDALIEYIKTLK